MDRLLGIRAADVAAPVHARGHRRDLRRRRARGAAPAAERRADLMRAGDLPEGAEVTAWLLDVDAA